MSRAAATGGMEAMGNHLVEHLGEAFYQLPKRLATPDCRFAETTRIIRPLGSASRVFSTAHATFMPEHIERWANPDDLLIALSRLDPDSPLICMGQVDFHIASHDYGLVEASHAVLAHGLSDLACALVDATVGQ